MFNVFYQAIDCPESTAFLNEPYPCEVKSKAPGFLSGEGTFCSVGDAAVFTDAPYFPVTAPNAKSAVDGAMYFVTNVYGGNTECDGKKGAIDVITSNT